jgi:hypothetical protein
MSEELEDMLGPLLRDHVDSYEKLETVLAVRARSRPIALGDVATLLRLTQGDAKRTLSALCASGLLVQQADGHFAEAEGALVRARIDALVQAYQDDSLSVVSRLSRQALVRLRRSAAFQNSAARRRTARGRAR